MLDIRKVPPQIKKSVGGTCGALAKIQHYVVISYKKILIVYLSNNK